MAEREKGTVGHKAGAQGNPPPCFFFSPSSPFPHSPAGSAVSMRQVQSLPWMSSMAMRCLAKPALTALWRGQARVLLKMGSLVQMFSFPMPCITGWRTCVWLGVSAWLSSLSSGSTPCGRQLTHKVSGIEGGREAEKAITEMEIRRTASVGACWAQTLLFLCGSWRGALWQVQI